MSELISIREFARRMGCSDTAVHRAIDAGKIKLGVVYSGKHKHGRSKVKIKADVATEEWANNHNPNYQRSAVVGEKLGTKRTPPVKPPKPPGQDEDEPETDLPPRTQGPQSLADVKRMQAQVHLKKEAILLRKLQGELVDKKAVYSALYAAGQEVKNTMLAIPDRYIDAILAAGSRNEAHSVLMSALVDALQLLAEIQERELTTT